MVAIASVATILICLYFQFDNADVDPAAIVSSLSQSVGETQAADAASFSIAPIDPAKLQSPENGAKQAVGPLTIATWNINYANRNPGEVSQMLRSSNADVICLQETTEDSENYLKREIGDLFPFHFTAGHTGNFFAEGFMVLSRTPIVEPRFTPPARTFFGHVVFQLDYGPRQITVISVHMTPFTSRDSRTIPQLISAVSQTEVDHEYEVRAVLKDIPDNQPVVVVGDFNSPSHGVAPTTLAQSGLTDLFGYLYPDPDQTHKSWDFRFGNGLRATWRIDYLFYSRHFSARSAVLTECQSSDHHLLIGRMDCETTAGPLPFDVSPDGQN
ncbi:MAG: endonuclease/exonuclease/phosphatase family protein [Planctomycetaceae bacterium]